MRRFNYSDVAEWETWNYCGFCGGMMVSDHKLNAYDRRTGIMLKNKRCEKYTILPFGDVLHDWIYVNESGETLQYEGI